MITPERYAKKALGSPWNTQADVLMFTNVSSILTEVDPKTKRSLISLYSRAFDPMGLLAPFLMTPTLLFQELWVRGLDWDQPLDSDTGRYMGDLEARID